MIPNQKVKIKWSTSTKNHYVSKGYSFTQFGNEIEVDIDDVPFGSQALVKYICDYCNGRNQIEEKEQYRQYKVLLRCRKNTNKDACGNKSCSYSKLKETRRSEINFKYPEIIKEWDYEKNEKSPNKYNASSKETVWWKCKEGHGWCTEVRSRAIYGSNCPKCSRKTTYDKCIVNTHPELIKEWNFDKNINISPNDFGKSSEKKVWWKCSKCSYEWDCQVKSRTILESGCPICSRKDMYDITSIKISHPEIVKQLHPLKNKNVNLDEIGKSSETKLWWICKTCSHTWKAQVKSRTMLNSGCPQCKESKGEKRIREYLKINKINFDSQYEFDDLNGVRGGKLKFDFSIFNDLNKLILLIEFDGEFHYMKIHETDSHERTKKHDTIKDEYCKNNDIPLLRIPYWEFGNIEEILTKELLKYGLPR